MDEVEIHIESEDPEVVARWRERLPALVEAARASLRRVPTDAALLYARHHIQELDPGEWSGLAGPRRQERRSPTVTEVLAMLRPVALWGHPDDGLQLDLSIGRERTD